MVKHIQTIRRQQQTNCLNLTILGGWRLKIDDHFKGFGCCENLKDLLQKLSSELIISNFIALKPTIRTSRLEVLYKKRVLKNFAKFTGKHLCQSLPEAEACNFIKKRDSETGVFL